MIITRFSPNNFPAVLVGGPPHSGKSVLIYSLTQTLRQQKTPHFVIRACPDGEGDWANENDQSLVRQLRYKGEWQELFVEQIVGVLNRRALPLLVDVGGKPQEWQQLILKKCTHAILLVGERAEDATAYENDLAYWQSLMEKNKVPIIAEIRSCRHAPSILSLPSTTPILRGDLSGLDRSSTAQGATFNALIQTLTALFNFDLDDLRDYHFSLSPIQPNFDLPTLAHRLGISPTHWTSNQLPLLEDIIPSQTPMGIYGRGPNWVYSMFACQANPAPIWLFDPRYGWMTPPNLVMQKTAIAQTEQKWEAHLIQHDNLLAVEIVRHGQYLDYLDPTAFPMPDVPVNQGLVLSGAIPHWLIMAAARQYIPVSPWIAAYHARIHKAIVIYSRDNGMPLGTEIPFNPAIHTVKEVTGK